MSKSKNAWASWPRSGFWAATEAASELLEGRAETEREYVVFDTETTDRNAHVARICEIAGARVRFPSGVVVERFAELVKHKGPMSAGAFGVHGITSAMLRDARPVDAVLRDFFDWAGERPLIAHNASYDRDVVVFDAKRSGLSYPASPVFCSLKIARRVLRKPTDVQSHSLSALGAWAKVDGGRAHRAAADVSTLVGVMTELLRRSGKSIEELHGEASRL